jgi:iron complex outermembrane receptor protein
VAVYGQGQYRFTDAWRATLGARYTEDKRNAEKADLSFARPAEGDQTYSRFTPSLVVDYQLHDDINLYAKVVTGYKAGGYNLRAGSIDAFESGFGKETLISYEVGMKSEWLDHRVRLNAALFRSDYDDIQVNIPLAINPAQTNVFNAGEARIDGAEIDFTAVPFEGMVFNFSYAYLDAQYRSVVDPQTGQDITASYALPMAPKNSYRVDLEYTFPWDAIGTLSANVDYSWQGKIYSQEDGPVSYGSYIDAYGLLGARLSWSDIAVGEGRFKTALWGRNLTDKEWVLDALGAFRGFVADRLVVFGQPRSVGVDLTYEF